MSAPEDHMLQPPRSRHTTLLSSLVGLICKSAPATLSIHVNFLGKEIDYVDIETIDGTVCRVRPYDGQIMRQLVPIIGTIPDLA
jgi:hypothetical protein